MLEQLKPVFASSKPWPIMSRKTNKKKAKKEAQPPADDIAPANDAKEVKTRPDTNLPVGAKSVPRSQLPLHADLALLVVTDNEWAAVKNWLTVTHVTSGPSGEAFYYGSFAPKSDSQRPFSVVAAKQSHAGAGDIGGSQHIVDALMRTFRVRLVVNVGVAFGWNRRTQARGRPGLESCRALRQSAPDGQRFRESQHVRDFALFDCSAGGSYSQYAAIRVSS